MTLLNKLFTCNNYVMEKKTYVLYKIIYIFNIKYINKLPSVPNNEALIIVNL